MREDHELPLKNERGGTAVAGPFFCILMAGPRGERAV